MSRQSKRIDKITERVNSSIPSWLSKEETTRSRSTKQEKRITNDLLFDKARIRKNSGATFGENDVGSNNLEVEAKTTYKKSYAVTIAEWKKLLNRTKDPKIPIMVIEFDGAGTELAVIDYKILLELLQ